MILLPAPVSTSRFTYDPATHLFTAEASDLPPLGRVYDDACDEGLTLVSQKTGTKVVFAVDHVERDGEGDLLYWDLRPADPRNAEYRVRVRIFND